MKRLPIGVDTYETMATECYYVDKTSFINEIDSYPTTSVILFTRPRRFGKSTALSMVRCFYETGKGDPSKYFEGTKVMATGGETWSRRGTFPVVSLTFKTLSPSSFQEMLRAVSHTMRLEYSRHQELLEYPFDEADASYLKKALTESLDPFELGQSLSTLIRLLSKCHSKKVIVLIDEYDNLLQEASFDSSFYNEALRFFQSFYGTALKGNENLRICLLTGVFEIAKDSLTSSLNNPIVFTCLDAECSSYFGFTKEEALFLMKELKQEEKLNEALAWYGGYRFGNTDIINPWSLIQYLSKQCKARPYWTNTSRNASLSRIIFSTEDSKAVLAGLLSKDDGVISPIDRTSTYIDGAQDKSSLLTTLVFLGYLTADEEVDIDTYHIKIPNKEIASIIQKEVVARFFSETGDDVVYRFRKALSSGNEKEIEEILKQSFLSNINYPGFGNEGLYQGIVLSLVAIAYRDAIVDAELPTGAGRCDIMISPKNNQNVGICIELKHLKTKTSSVRLNQSSLSALNQIKSMDYGERLRKQGVKIILYYGFSIAKKSIAVSSDVEKN